MTGMALRPPPAVSGGKSPLPLAGQVKQEDLLILQPCRHLPLGNALSNALGNGGLANARLTNEAGVVLLAAAQDLDGAVDLPVAADDIIQLPLPGFARVKYGANDFA